MQRAASCFIARAVALRPHPKKELSGGEDAYVATSALLGVADGVGSWSARGVDAALYSRALMKQVHDLATEDTLGSYVDLPALVDEAAAECSDIVGSSTVCLAALQPGTLSVLNLGDSGCLVLRERSIVYRSEEQQHRFNFPYQIGTSSKDSTRDAGLDRIDVQPLDLVCVASDGLFDNMFDEDIAQVLHDSVLGAGLRSPADFQHALTKAAQLLVARAAANAQDRQVATPFSAKCLDHGMQVDGGKVDDTTVVLGLLGSDHYDAGERTNEGQADFPLPHLLWP